MAHYECRDCGAHLGIAYGKCDSCTPQTVRTLEARLSQARYLAEMEFERKNAALYQTLKDAKKVFISTATAELQTEYERVYAENHPRNKRG